MPWRLPRHCKPLPSQTYLHECFTYDPVTGDLRWRERPRAHFANAKGCSVYNTQYAGKPAGSVATTGHVRVAMRGPNGTMLKLLVHRVVWKWMTGEDPPPMIDHPKDPADNRWRHLRAATHRQNAQNRRVSKNARSGLKGVYTSPKRKRFVAKIRVNGCRIHLGSFDTPEAAHAAYCEAARKHFGEFWSDGKTDTEHDVRPPGAGYATPAQPHTP